MLRLIFALVDIMLHRRGPDSLPSSPFLFWLLVAAMLTTSFAGLVIGGFTTLSAVVMLLVVAFKFWFVWALLRVFERQRRFRQTMSAALGTDAIITLLFIPFLPFSEPPTAETQALSVAQWAVLLLEVWSIDILAFVMARALDRPYLLALSIVIAYVLLMLALQATLLPRPT